MNKKRIKLHADLYKKVYLIRRAEQGIIENYASDAMKTPMHMSRGEEALVAGVCEAVGKKGQVLGTYRSHALYLAKTGEAKNFFAEMYGKVNAIADGKAGSMHLSAPEQGYLLSSAVVTTAIPVAVGVAFANNMRKTGAVTAVFFGDGAIEGGAFWESLNFACIKRLPIIFVCEDNDFAVFTEHKTRHGYSSISKVAAQFDCLTFQSSSTDAETIYDLTMTAIRRMQKEHRPVFMHLKYYRYLQHVGINEDFDLPYRSKKDSYKWKKVDPVLVARKKLVADGMTETRIKSIERAIDDQVLSAVKYAERAPYPKKNYLYKGVFHGEK
jgi:TPP-dependent pyruvate/acetoin dehydrogenase alpha subunit